MADQWPHSSGPSGGMSLVTLSDKLSRGWCKQMLHIVTSWAHLAIKLPGDICDTVVTRRVTGEGRHHYIGNKTPGLLPRTEINCVFLLATPHQHFPPILFFSLSQLARSPQHHFYFSHYHCPVHERSTDTVAAQWMYRAGYLLSFTVYQQFNLQRFSL